MKPGYKTSEFWGVVVTGALTVANGKWNLGLSDEAILGLAALASSYAISRSQTKAKKRAPTGEPAP